MIKTAYICDCCKREVVAYDVMAEGWFAVVHLTHFIPEQLTWDASELFCSAECFTKTKGLRRRKNDAL